jgi:hypothetical protein
MQEYANISLSEDWYNNRLGVSFAEDFWADPVRRTENFMQLEYEKAKKYPQLGLGNLNPRPAPVASDQYAHRFMAKLFGCEIVYTVNQAPSAVSLNLEIEELAEYPMPDLHKNEVLKKAISDADILRRKYGYVSGGINTGSPLNVAVTVFGESFLASCAGEPDIAQHILMMIAKTEIRLIYEYTQYIDESFNISPLNLGYGNCPAVMLSPALYKKVVLPVDLWYRQQCKHFYLHHCGVFDKYAELYTALSPASLDVGGLSDYRKLRKYFPDTMCSYIINSESIEGHSREYIDAVIHGVITDGGPADKISALWSYGISKNATDDNLIDFRTSAKRQGLVKLEGI